MDFANHGGIPVVGNFFLHVEKGILIAPLALPIWEKVFVLLVLLVTNSFLQRANGKMNAPYSVGIQEMVFAREDFNDLYKYLTIFN